MFEFWLRVRDAEVHDFNLSLRVALDNSQYSVIRRNKRLAPICGQIKLTNHLKGCQIVESDISNQWNIATIAVEKENFANPFIQTKFHLADFLMIKQIHIAILSYREINLRLLLAFFWSLLLLFFASFSLTFYSSNDSDLTEPIGE